MISGILIVVLLVALIIYFIHRIVTYSPPQTRKKDLLLYFLVAPLMIAAFVGFFFYADSKGIDENVSMKWLNISITAAFVFGYTVKRFWRYRQKWIFWAELGVLIVVHFVVLQRLHWKTGGYFWLTLVVGLPEMIVVFFLIMLMFDPRPGGRVILTAIPQGLLDGLPSEDQQAIAEIVGIPITLNGYDQDGRAELEFTDRNGTFHFIHVKPDFIKKAL